VGGVQAEELNITPRLFGFMNWTLVESSDPRKNGLSLPPLG
jgi:hypothetical protein